MMAAPPRPAIRSLEGEEARAVRRTITKLKAQMATKKH